MPSASEIVNVLLTQKASFQTHELAEALGVSRQAAHRHLRRMVRAGELCRIGRGRGTRYEGAAQSSFETWRREGLLEDQVWNQLSARQGGLELASADARRALEYGLTEIVNNAIDHSQSEAVHTRLFESNGRLGFEVVDDGIGVFENLCHELHFDDAMHALQELSKGKVTTRPEAHTGDGIFFVSKIADLFELESGDLCWIVDNDRADTTAVGAVHRSGTRVRFEIDRHCTRSLDALFREYAPNLTFSKTRITVRLFEYGVRFVSRSEAKRLLSGLEKFSQIILDFDRVEGVGQGFADEVFRVWQTAHSEIAIEPVRMSETVAFMVDRSRARET
jgi:predicted ArsR family transcriptional regulator